MDPYLTEDRELLEHRFEVMGRFLIRTRELGERCREDPCEACVVASMPVDIPESVAAPGHEPREDLEDAVVAIGARLNEIAAADGEGCPARRFVRRLGESRVR